MLDRIEDAIEDIKAGKIIIVVDDEDRENEGDFLMAAEHCTPESINFMATHGRGLICTPLLESRCDELGLNIMVQNVSAAYETAFTVSVDLLGDGCTTGISAQDRAKTVQALVNPDTKPEALGKPGHIFPLRAKSGGVLRRAGHTEAAIDFARLAGLQPAGAIVEIMNEDGTMARLPELRKVADKFDMKLVSIADLIQFRLTNESLIEKEVEVKMPTKYGDFNLTLFRQTTTNEEHLAITKGTWTEDEEILVRVHSSCVTGDILGSLRCDCGPQLHQALEKIDKAGKGAVIYMNQEGRGIGLLNKLKAYKLQEEGMDTVEANIELGFKMDHRDYGIGAQIIRAIGIKKMKLLSNNPKKRSGLLGYGIEVTGTEPIQTVSNPHNENYLKTKRDKMGHNLDL
jgi:3,4-dihydroxy 2-butanone 4-phosphate synthase/GTP cyclohydrolase II